MRFHCAWQEQVKVGVKKFLIGRRSFGRSCFALGGFLLALVGGVMMLPAGVSAYESVSTTATKSASVTVSAACSFTAGGGEYSRTVDGGSNTEITANNITTSCNDLNGYAVYAIGYSGDSYDSTTHTDLITSLGNNYNIKTAGNTYGSNWKMKITPVTNAVAANSFNTYQNIPATFTKVAQYTANTSGGTITPSYQISVAGSQPAGTYTGKVKYVLVHPNTMVAGTYTLNYLANGGSGTMANSTVTGLYNFETQTVAANGYTAPSGYQFAGWCTTSTAGYYDCDGISYAAGDVIPASPSTNATAGGTMSLYAYWSKIPYSSCPTSPMISGITYMQDITSSNRATVLASLTTNATYQIKDNRDDETYCVAKLDDGNLWMLDNLALDLTNSSVLSGMTEDNTNASNTTLSYLKNGGGTTSDKYAITGVVNWTDSPTYASGYSYSDPLVNLGSKNIVPSDATSQAGQYKVGGYYNYCAASAGSYCYGNGTSYGTSSGNATESICPKGWRMPGGSNTVALTATPPTGEFRNLGNIITGTTSGNYTGDNYAAYRAALHLPLSGYFRSGSVGNQGSSGYWWSSTRYDVNLMYGLCANTSTIYPAYSSYRYGGYSLRCVAGS